MEGMEVHQDHPRDCSVSVSCLPRAGMPTFPSPRYLHHVSTCHMQVTLPTASSSRHSMDTLSVPEAALLSLALPDCMPSCSGPQGSQVYQPIGSRPSGYMPHCVPAAAYTGATFRARAGGGALGACASDPCLGASCLLVLAGRPVLHLGPVSSWCF